MRKNHNIADEYFLQSKWATPVCNHFDSGGDGVKLTFAQGITFDGIPFEAEQWEAEDSKNVTFVFPVIEYLEVEEENVQDSAYQMDENIFAYHLKKEAQSFTVLKQGMAVCEEFPSDQSLVNYVDYLVTSGLIQFESEEYNGYAEYSVDREGNRVVSVIICLKEGDVTQAECSLEFRPFPDPGYKRKASIKRIK